MTAICIIRQELIGVCAHASIVCFPYSRSRLHVTNSNYFSVERCGKHPEDAVSLSIQRWEYRWAETPRTINAGNTEGHGEAFRSMSRSPLVRTLVFWYIGTYERRFQARDRTGTDRSAH